MWKLLYFLFLGEWPPVAEPPHRCEEFTQWTNRRGQIRIVAGGGNKLPDSEQYSLTKFWQERRCTLCGKLEQRDLAQEVEDESGDWDDDSDD